MGQRVDDRNSLERGNMTASCDEGVNVGQRCRLCPDVLLMGFRLRRGLELVKTQDLEDGIVLDTRVTAAGSPMEPPMGVSAERI